MEVMITRGIFKKQRKHTKMAGGFFSFEEEGTSTKLYGYGHGDHIRLRDETHRGVVRAGRLLPPVDSVFPLENGRQAFERLQAGKQFGKIVVRIS